MQYLGLYLHIPFCVQKCRYCDFCSAPADKGARTDYVRALCRHLEAEATRLTHRRVDTVYLGGGTPTVLEGEELAQILRTVKGHFVLTEDAEITVECNPVTGAEPLLRRLREEGVNRLSIGVQSAVEEELKLLGRPHGFGEVTAVFAAARRAGFENVSADVMFGIPAQTAESFSQTLDAVLALSPTHISAYGLRIEEGTPFHGMRKSLPLPDEDEEAQMAEMVAGRLRAAGYEHYEISNYAKAGYRSRHNMRYWLGADYLGFGPGAHSYLDGERFEIFRDRVAYVTAVEQGDFDGLRQNRTPIVGKELQDEYVMLRMRLSDGVDPADFRRRFGLSFEQAYGDTSRLEKAGLLYKNDRRIVFTEQGMRVSNAILCEWLDFGE